MIKSHIWKAHMDTRFNGERLKAFPLISETMVERLPSKREAKFKPQ
jgi:hypothetical protein